MTRHWWTTPGSFSVALALCAASLVALVPRAQGDDRPFVFVQDANGPVDNEIEAVAALDVGASASGAVRFVDPTVARRGVVQQLGAQVGVTPWLAIGAFGLVGLGNTADNPVEATGGGYLSFTILRPGAELHDGGSLGLALWAVREFEGVLALSGFINGSWVARRFALAGNLQLERRFVGSADPLDVIARIAANYGVFSRDENALRLGVEYVGQDLEDAIEGEEAEGGALHLFALSATSTFDERRVSLGIAPGVVVGSGAVGFGGRFTASYRF